MKHYLLDIILYAHDLSAWKLIKIVKRNAILVSLGSKMGTVMNV